MTRTTIRRHETPLERAQSLRLLLIVPTLIAIVVGFSFALNRNLTAAPGVVPAISATAFLLAVLFIAFILSGLPVFQGAGGCAGGCATLSRAAVSVLRITAWQGGAPSRNRDAPEFQYSEFEVPRPTAAAATEFELPKSTAAEFEPKPTAAASLVDGINPSSIDNPVVHSNPYPVLAESRMPQNDTTLDLGETR
jgi:hypothetical protein